MPNPLSVGGLRRIISEIGDEVSEAAWKAAKKQRAGQEEFETSGRVEAAGAFGFNKEGEFGFVGNLIAGAGDSEPANVTIGGDVGREWNSAGDGTLRLVFYVKVKRGVVEEEVE